MFSCCKRPPKKNTLTTIDRQLEISGLHTKLKFKILLLGAGESGKSTLLKQLKLCHRIHLTSQEIKDFCYSLKKNSLESMLAIVDKAEELGYEYETTELQDMANLIQSLGRTAPGDLINQEVAVAITKLWETKVIKDTYKRKNEFWILDSAEYFFENVERFVEPGFEPTEEDIVMARVLTTGITSTDIPIPPLQFTVVDVGGQRNERRKWLHAFDDVSALLYVVNLAGYNSVLYEDQSTNRMEESLQLFKKTANNPMFNSTPIILVLNKKDLFEKMIRETPITTCPCFRDYSGDPTDVFACMEYITSVFKAQINSGGDDRVQEFYIAARFKREVKTTWDDLVNFIRKRNANQIDTALKELVK